MDINNLLKKAKEALSVLENGREYPTRLVLDKVSFAAEKHNSDILLNTMRDVLQKKASSQSFISQKEIADLYNSLYQYSGSHSEFRNELGYLLPKGFGAAKPLNKGAEYSRVDMGKKIQPIQDMNENLKGISSVLSEGLTSYPKGSFASVSDPMVKKAEKFTRVQLNSIGCNPTTVKVVAKNNHFLLCNATYPTVNKREASIKIPVQFENGYPVIPSHFIDGEDLVELNKTNVYAHIKNTDLEKIATARKGLQGLRSQGHISIERTDLANNISKWANFEQELLETSTRYDAKIVRLASKVLDLELKSFGLTNPQIKLASSFERGLNFDVAVNTPSGKVQVSVPVEISNSQPLTPQSFSFNNEEIAFNKVGFGELFEIKKTAGSVSMNTDYSEKFDYNQLMNIMIVSAGNKDFKSAEDALYSIQNKYSGQQVINAISKYSQLLKNNSESSERNTYIKAAVQRGDLIKTPTSIDLYSPKFKLPLSKLSFDTKGNLIPNYRHQQENQKDSEKLSISTSQIKLT
jgi:hypothetical protein